ncbi:MAG: hypothetical protein IK086_04585 [Clostridia bacterium]|nr:hypothetical protein [Clostridia bacterium]
MNSYKLSGNVRYLGRTFETDNGVYFDWSGSGFEFVFEGTSAYAMLSGGEIPAADKDRAYVGVYVDGMPYLSARFRIDREGEYPLAENLPFGVHTVKVIKDTEMWYGRVAVHSVLTDGKLLAPPEKKKINIEFIGDSITCGYGNVCSTASPDFVTREESFAESFAAKTGYMLDADISVVAASGNGFYHDYGCSVNNVIPELYMYQDKLLAQYLGLPLEIREFDGEPCDFAVIKLGSNDWQFCSGADLPEGEFTDEIAKERKAAFIGRAEEFFKTVKRLRPGATVILIYENDLKLKEQLITAAKRAGDIELLEIVPKRVYEDVGANGHYSMYTHTRLANLLCKRIKELC